MTTERLEDEEQMPLWDVALAALVTEKYQHKGKALHISDFQRLSTTYAIRFDDIMDTVLRMVINGNWVYKDTSGAVQEITQEAFDNMYKGGRLVNTDLEAFDGSWSPVED